MPKAFKISFIVFIVLLLIFGYWQYSSRDKESEKEAITTKQVESFSGEQKILETLTLLRSININTDFFDNKVFQNLVDFSRELVSEPVGRPNPFLPSDFLLIE